VVIGMRLPPRADEMAGEGRDDDDDGGGRKGGDASHQLGVAADFLQVEGVEEQEPGQDREGQGGHRGRAAERRAAEEPQVQQGFLAAALGEQEGGQSEPRDSEEPGDGW
jgi:hypothetical protein